MVLESVRLTEGKCYLMMNTLYERFDKMEEVIPSPDGPTMMDTADGSTVVVHAVVNERDVSGVVSDLRNVDASSILAIEIEWLVE